MVQIRILLILSLWEYNTHSVEAVLTGVCRGLAWVLCSMVLSLDLGSREPSSRPLCPACAVHCSVPLGCHLGRVGTWLQFWLKSILQSSLILIGSYCGFSHWRRPGASVTSNRKVFSNILKTLCHKIMDRLFVLLKRISVFTVYCHLQPPLVTFGVRWVLTGKV